MSQELRLCVVMHVGRLMSVSRCEGAELIIFPILQIGSISYPGWPIDSTRVSIWAFASGHPGKMNLPGHSLMFLSSGIRANRRETYLALYPGRTHLSQISLAYPGIRKLHGPPSHWSMVSGPGPWSLSGPWSMSLVPGPWSWSLVLRARIY